MKKKTATKKAKKAVKQSVVKATPTPEKKSIEKTVEKQTKSLTNIKPVGKDAVAPEVKKISKQSWWSRFVKKETVEETAARKEAEAQRRLIAKEVKKASKEEEAQKAAAKKGAKEETKKGTKQQGPAEDELLVKIKKPPRVKKTLKQLLSLAGIERDPVTVYKALFHRTIVLSIALTVLAVIMGAFYGETFKTAEDSQAFLGFVLALWTVGFAFIFMALGMMYAVYIDLKINERRKQIEAVFPDYLQLAAANLSAGMTLDRALWSAVRPRFGVLAKEMEDVAKKTMTGYDLERSLKEFSAKYDSLVIKRSIDLITEGARSGGRMADILNKIAINIQENNILQKEMAANVTTYVIFISFAALTASPFLFGLSTQLLIVIQAIAGSIAVDAGSSQGVGLTLSSQAVKLADFKVFSFVALTVTSVMSAAIVSVIRKGTVKDGLRLIPFYWAIAISIYFFSSWVLSSLFSGFFAG